MKLKNVVRNPYLVASLLAFSALGALANPVIYPPTANITAQITTATTTVVSAVVSGPIAFVPPPPMTNETFMTHQFSALMDHPQLNKISDLLNLVELEGMQKHWYLSEANVAHFNELVIQKNTRALEKDVRKAVLKIMTEFYSGRVRPAQIITRYFLVNSKRLQSYQVEDVDRYLKNEISAEELINELRPKNKYYAGLIEQYRKFKSGRDLNYFPMGPESIAIIRPTTKDVRAISLVRYRLHVLGYTNDINNPNYSSDLRQAIVAFQANHKLSVDGTIGPMGWKILNFNIENLLARLIINIDRTRWLPDDMGYEYVNINLASQKLKYYIGEEETLEFNVVVGKPERPTPILFEKINHFILNPTWTVPDTILLNDKLKIFKANPAKVADLHIKIVDKVTYLDVDPYIVDWDLITKENYPYHFIQTPGPWNALGFIKFPPMLNTDAIFMHDTDDRIKLREQTRLFSSGCIRLEKPFELAEKLLNDPEMTAMKLREMTELIHQPVIDPNFPMPVETPEAMTQTVNLNREVPIYALYSTTSLSSTGVMTLSNDYYGLDLLTFNIMNQAL